MEPDPIGKDYLKGGFNPQRNSGYKTGKAWDSVY